MDEFEANGESICGNLSFFAPANPTIDESTVSKLASKQSDVAFRELFNEERNGVLSMWNSIVDSFKTSDSVIRLDSGVSVSLSDDEIDELTELLSLETVAEEGGNGR